MEENNYIKRISHEEFKKLDINTISYIQLYNGEILMLDHPYMHNMHNDVQNNSKVNKELKNNYINEEKEKILENKSNKKRRKRKKNKNKNKKNEEKPLLKEKNKEKNLENPNKYKNKNNYNYKQDSNYLLNSQNKHKKEAKLTLPKDYFGQNNTRYRSNSVKFENKGRILFKEEWKEIQDYDFVERLKFYDNIPKRAKYWERESYDPTRSLFQSKRLEIMEDYNYHQNITNYNPIPQDSFSSSSEEEKEKQYENIQSNKNKDDNQYEDNNQYENNNYNYNNDNYNNNENYNTDNYYNDNENYNYNNSYENQINQIFSNQKDLYNLVFGPQLSQYILGEQANYQSGQYGQEYYQNNNDLNYYQAQSNDDYYNYNYNDNDNQNDFYQNDYDYYEPILSYDNENDNKNIKEY